MAQPEFVYLALGDSTGVGVGASEGGGYPDRLLVKLLASGRRGRLLNVCVSGAVVSDVLARQLDYGMACDPTLVTLGIGINDLWRGNSPGAYGATLARIGEKLSKGRAKIIASELPDLSLAPVAQLVPGSLVEGRIELFNAQIRSTAARFGWIVAELYSASQKFLPGHPELFSADGFHPSETGYARWAEAMWPQVSRSADL